MRKRFTIGIFSALGTLLLILDSKTALSGAAEGITLCVSTVLPSLFPFFVLSILLTSTLTGVKNKLLYLLGRLCRIPAGCESILLVGLLGGYPVGAQAVAQAFHEGQISRRCAHRLLGFCSNAGPAFLFGIVAGKFSQTWSAWLLWGIHILSAIIVGIFLPHEETDISAIKSNKTITLPQALEKAVRITALVCGWVVIFRVMISFLNHWLFWLFPVDIQVIILGLLELANGCCELEFIQNEGLRFICASAVLGFGGLCISMQTFSVTESVGSGWYLPGKTLQTILSIFLSSVCVFFLFPAKMQPQMLPVYPAAAILMLGICVIILRKREKRSSNPAIIGV